MDLAYYPGCSLQASSAIYDAQCKRVLSTIGINLHELDDWNCCGATSASKVDDFIAVAMPARNLGIADASEYTELVIPCSACYSRMLVAQKILEFDRNLLSEINGELSNKVTGRTKILSILEAIQPVVNSGDLAKRVTRKLEGLKPACYYGCMQTRFSYECRCWMMWRIRRAWRLSWRAWEQPLWTGAIRRTAAGPLQR